MNSFGHILRLTTFGESHGPAIGGVLDGFPSKFPIDLEKVQQALDRRRPGTGSHVSARREADKIKLLSGLYNGLTLGSPIAFIIENTDARPQDYEAIASAYRPNHADYTYEAKYGIRDPRGGGRASARETAVRVAAGEMARQYLETKGITINSFISSIGKASRQSEDDDFQPLLDQVTLARAKDDSVGGIITCTISGVPAGLGRPLYGKLQSLLAAAIFSIPAVKGFEYGDGFSAASAFGSEQADEFTISGSIILTTSNHSGGIQGGISTGMPITMRIAFKPTPTIPRPLHTVTTTGQSTLLKSTGRHDPCVVLRACPVVEAMTALTLLDAYLLS